MAMIIDRHRSFIAALMSLPESSPGSGKMRGHFQASGALEGQKGYYRAHWVLS
jgi:hypothetical protein